MTLKTNYGPNFVQKKSIMQNGQLIDQEVMEK